jgi:hypothetical protein
MEKFPSKNEKKIGWLDNLYNQSLNETLEEESMTAIYVRAGGSEYSFIPVAIDDEKITPLSGSATEFFCAKLAANLPTQYDWSEALSITEEPEGYRITVDYSLVTK